MLWKRIGSMNGCLFDAGADFSSGLVWCCWFLGLFICLLLENQEQNNET